MKIPKYMYDMNFSYFTSENENYYDKYEELEMALVPANNQKEAKKKLRKALEKENIKPHSFQIVERAPNAAKRKLVQMMR